MPLPHFGNAPIQSNGNHADGYIPKFSLCDSDGNPIGSIKGALNIHDAHVHNTIINRYMKRETATITTLTSGVLTGGTTYQISVADATGFINGDFIHINTTSEETTLPRIVSSTPVLPTTGPAVFNLDRRLDGIHAIGDIVTRTIADMSTTIGTLSSPIKYYVSPPSGQIWHIVRLIFSMVHGTSGDLGLFGNINTLTNGVILRARINGQYGTLTNWKSNADIKTDMYDVDFDTRSGGGGSYGTSGRGTFERSGAIVRLDGDTNDRLEIYIQDDITALDLFTMKMQGHIEGA